MDHKSATVQDVTDWHMDDNKWDWIGYGYWVDFDGTIYECRGYEHLNAAVKNENHHTLSIGFRGQYTKNNLMPDAQFKAGVDLIKHLKSKLNIKLVAGHYFWNETECPGKSFPIVNMLRKVDEKDMNTFKDADKISTYAIEAVENMVLQGIMKGDTDGNFRPLEPITRQDLAVVINNLLTTKKL